MGYKRRLGHVLGTLAEDLEAGAWWIYCRVRRNRTPTPRQTAATRDAIWNDGTD